MLFNSVQFLIFFPIVVAVYFLIPFKLRWIFLLAASYYFYMCWNPWMIILIMLSTVIDYIAGIMIDRTYNKRKRKLWLLFSLVPNLGILFTFKYLGFATDTAQSALELLNIPMIIPRIKLLLPVGISFYTFQSLSYSLDVYKGKRNAERHLGKYALYVAFFPPLVAGPIERSENLLPQFYEKHKFDYSNVTEGLRLMAWGMFKKVVIADRAAIIVNMVYDNPQGYSGAFFVIATLLFAFQIYCDFSGYSDIATGVARVMGYRLMKNFDRPYNAKSIADFWRRWHISLSTWFKDYVYFPLGGSRVTIIKWARNIMLVFLLSGFWHGASWTFVLWGLIHGALQVFERATSCARKKFPNFVNVFITFLLVDFAWVFFRANTISDAFYILGNMFRGLDFGAAITVIGARKLAIVCVAIIIMEIIQYIGTKVRIKDVPLIIRWGGYFALVGIILLFAEVGSHQFIYFQF